MEDKIKELIENWNLDEEIYDEGVLEPREDFNGGIIGITEDKQHLIYSYEKLAESLATSYERQFYKDNPNPSEDEIPDFYQDAIEWIDCNTIRTIPYLKKEHAPIIIYEV